MNIRPSKQWMPRREAYQIIKRRIETDIMYLLDLANAIDSNNYSAAMLKSASASPEVQQLVQKKNSDALRVAAESLEITKSSCVFHALKLTYVSCQTNQRIAMKADKMIGKIKNPDFYSFFTRGLFDNLFVRDIDANIKLQLNGVTKPNNKNIRFPYDQCQSAYDQSQPVLMYRLEENALSGDRSQQLKLVMRSAYFSRMLNQGGRALVNDDHFYFVTDATDGLSFQQYDEQSFSKKKSRKKARKARRKANVSFMLEMTKSIALLHEIDLIHGNIQPDAFTIAQADKNKTSHKIILQDFASIRFEREPRTLTVPYTPAYLDNELQKLVRSHPNPGICFNKKSDVYALGLTIAQRFPELFDVYEQGSIKRIRKRSARKYKKNEKKFVKYVLKLCAQDPALRPESATEVLHELKDLGLMLLKRKKSKIDDKAYEKYVDSYQCTLDAANPHQVYTDLRKIDIEVYEHELRRRIFVTAYHRQRKHKLSESSIESAEYPAFPRLTPSPTFSMVVADKKYIPSINIDRQRTDENIGIPDSRLSGEDQASVANSSSDVPLNKSQLCKQLKQLQTMINKVIERKSFFKSNKDKILKNILSKCHHLELHIDNTSVDDIKILGKIFIHVSLQRWLPGFFSTTTSGEMIEGMLNTTENNDTKKLLFGNTTERVDYKLLRNEVSGRDGTSAKKFFSSIYARRIAKQYNERFMHKIKIEGNAPALKPTTSG